MHLKCDIPVSTFAFQIQRVPLHNGPIRVHQFMAGHFRVDIKRKLQTTVQTVDAVEFTAPKVGPYTLNPVDPQL